MVRITLLCGLPRCGKTTEVHRLISIGILDRAVIVCPDRIRKVIFGHQFHPPVEGMVWSMAHGMVRLCLEQNKDVIIDATNTTVGERSQWVRIAKEFDAIVEVMVIDTEYGICLIRNEASPEDEKLPIEAMERMRDRFEMPDKEVEGFRSLMVIPGEKRDPMNDESYVSQIG